MNKIVITENFDWFIDLISFHMCCDISLPASTQLYYDFEFFHHPDHRQYFHYNDPVIVLLRQ
jgi:hypothetical protein